MLFPEGDVQLFGARDRGRRRAAAPFDRARGNDVEVSRPFASAEDLALLQHRHQSFFPESASANTPFTAVQHMHAPEGRKSQQLEGAVCTHSGKLRTIMLAFHAS